LCNDSESALIGASLKGYLKGKGNVALFVVGTGLGFSVWRNGRRWRPGRKYPLLGSMKVGRTFDEVVSISKLSEGSDEGLRAILSKDENLDKRERYFSELAEVFVSAGILYSLDEILFSGGLVCAAEVCNFDLEKEVLKYLPEGAPKIRFLNEGGYLQLNGIANLAKYDLKAREYAFSGNFSSRTTEQKYAPKMELQKKSPKELTEIFWKAEQDAGERLKESLPAVAKCAEKFAERMKKGGRLIYVGCGTSGRIAAIDDVELSCTFGLPDEKSMTLISGGIADSALGIEVDFEEDASAIPEIMLMNLNENDIVVGISASSTAYYVRSALSYATEVGALTTLISESLPERTDFFDLHIPLNTGPEVISGSTRLKAGTATKKILNMLSSTTMILLGKIEECYMIDVACVNEKLKIRAMKILNSLYGWDAEKAKNELEKYDYKLIDIVEKVRNENQ
jgi:N-acetylmuramic acid 6-phosphate etherase